MPHFSETKQQVIEAALMLKRSSEEIVMLREESQNTLQYYQRKQQVIAHVLESLGTKCDAYSRGAIALLHKMHSVVSKIHQECLQAFAMMSVTSERPCTATEEDSNDEYSSDDSVDLDSL